MIRVLFFVLVFQVVILLGVVVIVLLGRRNSAKRSEAGVCGSCGYDVRAASSLTCSECGADLRRVGIIPSRNQRK